ncbi:MAG: Do family serine endopeptidase [Spirochaetota bacterium]
MKKIMLLIAVSVIVPVFASQVPAHAREGIQLDQFNETLTEIAKRTIPKVVNISAQKIMKKSGQKEQMNPFGKKFPFNMPPKSEAMGSGVIVDKKGYIVTNNHVIKDTSSITITLSDSRSFTCEVVGTDPATDIAVIRIKGKVPDDLPVIEMADSDKIQVGEVAIAIGNPFGFTQTVTMGIISATGREGVGLADYEFFIQTDAAINPGNSGGALVNSDGKLIGINTAIFSRSGGYMGIGFAIPANMVKSVVNELMTRGKVVRGWLGVYIQNVNEDLAANFGYDGDKGVLISDVMEDSPAEKSDVKIGDIIIGVDGKKVDNVYGLRRVIASSKPGSTVNLKIVRKGETKTVKFTIGEMPVKTAGKDDETKSPSEDSIGLVVHEIDERTAYQFRIKDTSGVVVVKVKPGSYAAAAGIIKGDVIKEIEKSPVAGIGDYHRLLKEYKEKNTLLFLVKRGGVNKFVVVKKSE